MQFCEAILDKLNDNPDFLKQIVFFSDEATFFVNGTVNRQNYRYWSDKNPHWMIETHTQHPQKVNVWAGICNNQIIGPYFFDGTLTGERYWAFLQRELIPELVRRFPDDVNCHLIHRLLWFQQDGAPPHYLQGVRDYLNIVFPNRWIGRRGAIEWPARSPDLTPLDYFLWGYLKSKIYVNRPQNIEQLKDRIREEIALISADTVLKVLNEFSLRIDLCFQRQGNHIENVL